MAREKLFILNREIKNSDDLHSLFVRECDRKHPISDCVLITENDKVLDAYNRMVNSIFRKRIKNTNINRQRT